MKYQVLFSLKNNEKIFMNVVCCCRDWRFKVYNQPFVQCVISFTVIVFTGELFHCPFIILGVSGLFHRLCSIFDGNPVSKQCRS